MLEGDGGGPLLTILASSDRFSSGGESSCRVVAGALSSLPPQSREATVDLCRGWR